MGLVYFWQEKVSHSSIAKLQLAYPVPAMKIHRLMVDKGNCCPWSGNGQGRMAKREKYVSGEDNSH